MPTVTYFGHAAVGLAASSGERLIVDPYAPGALGGKLQYGRIPVGAEYVVCSHEHADHSAVEAMPGPTPTRLEEGPGGAFGLSRHRFDHDEYGGRRFGGAVDVLAIEVDDYTVVHTSDIGQSPGPRLPPAIRRPDLLFVPVGGFYTIGAAQALEWCRRLDPGLVVPTHYATSASRLPLHDLEPFVHGADRVERLDGATFELGEALPRLHGSILVAEPACLVD